ncbi:hypothetical protein CTT30_22720 (plasmid) [Vibrio coralliilyticus]|nr:hypothetical protein CTT30_22720 [Vibrio coralliilyticus]
MPRKFNRGSLFVWPDSKRDGAFIVNIPAIWNDEDDFSGYFGARKWKHPKLVAQKAARHFVERYYGKERTDLILSIPRYLDRLTFGCGVSARKTVVRVRGRPYHRILIEWPEYDFSSGEWRPKKRSKSINFTSSNLAETEHRASLIAAEKRALVALSELDKGVFDLEFDLSAIQ